MHPLLITSTLLLSAVSARLRPEKRQLPLPAGFVPCQQALDVAFGGQVKLIGPVAQPCYSNFQGSLNSPSQDSAECARVQGLYTTNELVSEPGYYTQENWGTCHSRNQDCELDWSDPSNPAAYDPPQTCYQGSVPPVAIEILRPSDAQTVFNIAKRYPTVPLTIKASGHDYKGRSSAPNSVMLWTHHLNSTTFRSSYRPAGCYTSYKAITVGAGAGFREVYQLAEANDVTFVGGLSDTVAPSGGYLAGGHSPLSNTLGLAVDNLIETKVVTPDGQYLTASRCQNKDLFFAIAGGSPGTFGVVIESTFKVHPKVSVALVQIAFVAPNASVVDQFSDLLVDNSLNWVKNIKLGGVLALNPVGLNLAVLGSITASQATVAAAVKPLTDFAASLGAATVINQVTTSSSWYDAYSRFFTTNGEAEPFSLNMAISSRLVPDTNFNTASARATLKATMRQALDVTAVPNPAIVYGAPIQILVTTPYNTPATGFTSETPAWRKAIWHTAFAEAWLFNATLAEINQAYSQVDSAAQLLRNITPGSGAYQNEAAVHEPNWQSSFWSPTAYSRLQAIKARYDPSKLLQVWQGIGYDPANPRYQCYV